MMPVSVSSKYDNVPSSSSPAVGLSASTVNEVSVTTTSNTTYICQCSPACRAVLDGSIQTLRHHLKREHLFRSPARDSVQCPWAGCMKIMQRENILRHIITRHLRVKVSCPACETALSRWDVQYSVLGEYMVKLLRRIQPYLTETMSYCHAGVAISHSCFPLVPHFSSDIATILGWASHTIPINANYNRVIRSYSIRSNPHLYVIIFLPNAAFRLMRNVA
ncbi:hypothetical protein EV363DRAFT_691587 [Boletus edulis]|uniref:C2H2-type domain-containing protein n=1 Tax=Boletus edulis BED1 TaxID=1328754 RepID=A0AAD4BWU9_BOLED|nr:hypothetical protein EV363DRAFT_691587 [Boletus edulis]KAF8441761.1 hypothetical protein L210DRAFT_2089963 [Boletus edulis BED1]